VEHLLAAAYAIGIDDLTIDVDGPELPIGDGSAANFFDALERVEMRWQECGRATFRIGARLEVIEGNARYVVIPGDGLRVSVTIEFDHPNIGRQTGCFDITQENFGKSLARARTFGFKEEVDELYAKGLAKGASESTVIVLTETGIFGTALRWPDEFVRHKAVDLLGDLALLGARVEGEIAAFRPNHKGNTALARFIERTANMGEIL
jgi:UDP-3-O-acyl N-acetylglucosamine deacetylase